MLKVDCSLLHSGILKHEGIFYFCDCDEHRREVICSACIKTCHAGHNWSEGQKGFNVCSCGLNGHKPFTKTYEDRSLLSKCPFWELNFYAKSNTFFYDTEKSKRYCSFCALFCDDYFEKKSRIELKDKIENKSCECQGKTHKDTKKLLSELGKFQNEDRYFGNKKFLMTTQLINLIFEKPEISRSFVDRYKNALDETKTTIELDNFRFAENIQFTILFNATSMLANLLRKCTSVHNYSPELLAIFEPAFVVEVAKAQMGTDAKIIELKTNFAYCFYKIVVRSSLKYLPHLSPDDYENFNPVQRILLMRTDNMADFNVFFHSKFVNRSKLHRREYRIYFESFQ